MADVQLRSEKTTHPPAICMRCGEPATSMLAQHVFSTSPWWCIFFVFFGIWPYFVLEFVFRLIFRMRFDVPVCERHRKIFVRRTLGFYGGWVGIVGSILLSVFFAGCGDLVEVLNWVMVFPAVAVVALNSVAVVCWSCLTGIKAYDTTAGGMMVCGVSEEFAKAYEKSYYLGDAIHDSSPPKWRARIDEDGENAHGIKILDE